MIVYFLTYAVNPSGKSTERPRCHSYQGKVTFIGPNEVWLYDANDRPIKKRRVTVFDDNSAPPKLIREDYPIEKLLKFKYVTLPEQWIDGAGNIVNAKGQVIFAGPKNP